MDTGQIILYQTQGGETKIEVRLANESVWLTADQMAELFQRDRSTIQRHVKKIYDEGELKPDSTCAFFAQVQTEGKRQVERQIPIYNLDMIISVGYRVNSHRGVQFRQWATQVLKEYMIKRFALNDERLKGNSGGAYWHELLNRIRDIRSSEKVMYRHGRNNITAPGYIVEFKMPKSKYYASTDDPIIQACNHARSILDGKYVLPNGIEPIKASRISTPVYIYIVCDITPRIKDFAVFSDLTKSPDGERHFGLKKNYNAYIEVVSYRA